MAFFGFGQESPYAEAAQDAQDRQAAFDGIKDNLPALGLIAGLSMLARNNGTRSVGQLVGMAGGDALSAYSTWKKLEEAKARQKMLDDERKEQREYDRGQDAWRNDMAERRFGLEQAKMAQDMQMARQRMGLAYAGLAAQRQAMALAAAKEKEKEAFDALHREVNGVWYDKQDDGTWAESKTLNMYGPDGQRIGGKAMEEPKYSDVSKFMSDYNSASSVYDSAGEALRTLYVGATQENAFGDMEMIYALNHMYDPRSVVRGEEFDQLARAGGLPTQVVNFYNKVANGGRLTPEQRKQMLKLASDLFAGHTETKKGADERFRTLARPYGYNTGAIIRDDYAGTRENVRKYLGLPAAKNTQGASSGSGTESGGSGQQRHPLDHFETPVRKPWTSGRDK